MNGILVAYKPNGIILDAREHKGIGPKGQENAANMVVEYAKTTDRFYNAIIIPKDVFSKVSVDGFKKRTQDVSPITETQYFTDVQSAREWLDGLL